MELGLGFFSVEQSAYMLQWDVGYGCKFKNYMGGGRHRGVVGTMSFANYWKDWNLFFFYFLCAYKTKQNDKE